METLNQLVAEYTEYLRLGKLQVAYRGILEYLGKLRNEFVKNYPDYEIGSNIYQGYMDMSYFSLNTRLLHDKGLKIALVYQHEKGAFEIWLSARNREILKKYQAVLNDRCIHETSCFHDKSNEDAILEYNLTADPNFDKPNILTQVIIEGTKVFLSTVASLVGA